MFGFPAERPPHSRESELCGTWQGAYGTLQKVEKLVVTLKPDQAMEFYGGEQPQKNVMGTYTLQGDTAIVITCQGQQMVQPVQMYGYVNESKNFVDGVWESEGSRKGSFYLKKQSFRL